MEEVEWEGERRRYMKEGEIEEGKKPHQERFFLKCWGWGVGGFFFFSLPISPVDLLRINLGLY